MPVEVVMHDAIGSPRRTPFGPGQQSRNSPWKKAAVLLDALVHKDFSQVNHAAQAAGIQEERLSTVSCRTPSASAEDVAIASAGTAEGILYRFQDLQALDDRSQALSVATNWAYWRLGVSYQSFVDVRAPGSKGCHSS
jgi:hypothetical protein